jgi:predicted Zn-dependent peptidase
MYDDQPMWLAYDLAKQYHFASHPLSKSILGTPTSVGNLKRDQMYEYFQRRYVPANITAVAAGNFDFDALVALVEKQCGAWDRGVSRRQGVRETEGSGEFKVHTKETVNQEHVVLVSPGPAVKSPLCYAAHTLAMIFGDDSGSRLYWALVDRGLADSADSSFHEYDGTGAVYTMFSCDPERAQKNLNIVQGLLSQMQREGVTEEELNQAKNKVLARLVRISERPMGRMNALGHNWIYLKTYRSVDDELRNFEAVTVRKIQQVLERYPIDHVTTLALGPLAKLRRPNGNGKK